MDELTTVQEAAAAILAAVSAGVVGMGRSHLQVRDRLKHAEVRLEVVEGDTEKLEDTTRATHDSVIRLEAGVLGIEADMKNSIRRQEKIQKTINSIERLFHIPNGGGDVNGGGGAS